MRKIVQYDDVKENKDFWRYFFCVNFPCAEIEDYEEEYYGENSKLLKRVKEKYDKDDFFNFEQDINTVD